MVSPEHTPDTPSSEIDWVSLNRIRTDHDVNTRYVDQNWVDARVPKFDPDKLGTPVLSARPDGTFVVLDGQNRVELCRRVGWGDQKILCKVFTGLDKRQEAELFLGHNDARPVQAFAKFMARITAGESDAVAIAGIVAKSGWELYPAAADKKIAAVAALEKIWKTTPPNDAGWRGTTLTAVLAMATEAWGYQRDAANGHVLQGLGLVINRFGNVLETVPLTRKLSARRPIDVLADARGRHSYNGGVLAACVAESVVHLYNTHRRQGALPPWRAERATD